MEQLVIFLMLVVNTDVRVWQEGERPTRKARSMRCSLQPIRSHRAAMLRDAALLPTYAPSLSVRDLVPGDDVQLRIGDRMLASVSRGSSS